MRLAKLQAGVDPSVLATQPFAVAQPSASQVRLHPGLAE
jgi:hypothetical protein